MKIHSLSLYKNQFSAVLDGSEEESLERLGKILHFSKSRSLIVKCDETRFVRMGTRACDSKLKEIGKVQDIFGPVSAPYLSIRPAISSPVKYVGRIVYSID
jgi:RNA-binding protein